MTNAQKILAAIQELAGKDTAENLSIATYCLENSTLKESVASKFEEAGRLTSSDPDLALTFDGDFTASVSTQIAEPATGDAVGICVIDATVAEADFNEALRTGLRMPVCGDDIDVLILVDPTKALLESTSQTLALAKGSVILVHMASAA